MKRLAAILVAVVAAVASFAGTPIMGLPQISADDMTRFVTTRNPDFDPEVARAFYDVGTLYGIRGDIALCQAILETGWFRFDGGTAVTPDQHNYCGMGVTSRGSKGCTFDSPRDGVTALIQHLYAYCCTSPLPDGETLLDPRYKLVARGTAPCWEDLAGRWAMNPDYARSILSIFSSMCRESQSSF